MIAKKMFLKLGPKYQVDMTVLEKYKMAAMLSGGRGIFSLRKICIVRCL